MKLSDYMKDEIKNIDRKYLFEAADSSKDSNSAALYLVKSNESSVMDKLKNVFSVAACVVLVAAIVISFVLMRGSISTPGGDDPADSFSNTGGANDITDSNNTDNSDGAGDLIDTADTNDTTDVVSPDDTTLPDDTTTDGNGGDDIFVTDLNAYELVILSPNTLGNLNYCINDFDEMSDDLYEYAIYSRNRTVEEMLNVTIKEERASDGLGVFELLRTSVNSGIGDYDLCFNSMRHSVISAGYNYYYDLHDLPHIDLDRSWWNTDATEQLSLFGKNPLAAGDISMSDKEGLWAMYYNRDILSALTVDDPYELVLNDEWTWDKMLTLSTDVSADGDVTGFVTTPGNVAASWTSAQQKLISTDKNGSPSVSFGTDAFSAIFHDIRAVMDGDSTSVIYFDGSEGIISIDAVDEFADGDVFFTASTLSFARYLRNKDVNFGIVPYPKYDTDSKEYTSFVTPYSNVMGIPGDCTDTYAASIITEALAAMGAEYITPAYYEALTTSPSARDEQSVTMLDMIIRNRSYDIGVFLNSNGIFSELIKNTNISPIDIYNDNLTSIEEELESSFRPLRDFG